MYFHQIYRFEVDLLKKFPMSLFPEQSHPREISAGRYEFGWGASPDASISKEPAKHNYATATISPALIAIVVVLGSTLLVVSYYKIFAKYCKASRWRPFSGGSDVYFAIHRFRLQNGSLGYINSSSHPTLIN